MHVHLCQPQEAARIRKPPSLIKHSEESLEKPVLLTDISTDCRRPQGREKSMTVVAIDRGYSFGKDHILSSHPA